MTYFQMTPSNVQGPCELIWNFTVMGGEEASFLICQEAAGHREEGIISCTLLWLEMLLNIKSPHLCQGVKYLEGINGHSHVKLAFELTLSY